jgi:membrane associated rhomboid family serine protease
MGGLGVLLLARRQDLRGIVTLLALNVLISVLVPGISLVGHLGGLVAGALVTGVLVVGRRKPAVQIAGVAVLAVVLVAVAVGASTVS